MTESPELDPTRLPGHVAIIMDGNGRWAQNRGMPRPLGHKQGVVSVREIVTAARELEIKALTLYAFSTENWNRPAVEVQALMGLLKTFLRSELDALVKNNVSLRTIGQIDRLPVEVREILVSVSERTKDNDGLVLNLALSYGGRDELTRAVRKIAEQCRTGALSPTAITEETISTHLDTAGLKDPDLLIRTGGESRLSNFLLWQLSYAEILITDTLWPDFRKEQFIDALKDFQSRQRRFGKTSEQVLAK
ncbi:MAG: isoprenyl transferase [Proteobacteria bacterium]|nr:isoprenyl transferase [Pseudomonadota bacterium]MBU1738461.1 isoprenyl transferase [Pseudomonadota bacterium]